MYKIDITIEYLEMNFSMFYLLTIKLSVPVPHTYTRMKFKTMNEAIDHCNESLKTIESKDSDATS